MTKHAHRLWRVELLPGGRRHSVPPCSALRRLGCAPPPAILKLPLRNSRTRAHASSSSNLNPNSLSFNAILLPYTAAARLPSRPASSSTRASAMPSISGTVTADELDAYGTALVSVVAL